MLDTNQYAKRFQFNLEFTNQPQKYGCIHLHQVGEVSYEMGFEDTHKQWCSEISIILSGTGIFTVGDQQIPVKENEIIINPDCGFHTIQAPSSQLRYLYLGFSFDEELEEPWAEVKKLFDHPLSSPKITDQYKLTELLDMLITEFHSPSQHSPYIIGNHLENILLLTHRAFTAPRITQNPSGSDKKPVGALVYNVIRYVDSHIFTALDVRSVAKELNFNYSYLSHVFKQKTGVSLQQYIIYKKVEKSCDLIRENRLSITEIAFLLNYESLQSFSKTFKNVTGLSPSVYKSNHLGESV